MLSLTIFAVVIIALALVLGWENVTRGRRLADKLHKISVALRIDAERSKRRSQKEHERGKGAHEREADPLSEDMHMHEYHALSALAGFCKEIWALKIVRRELKAENQVGLVGERARARGGALSPLQNAMDALHFTVRFTTYGATPAAKGLALTYDRIAMFLGHVPPVYAVEHSPLLPGQTFASQEFECACKIAALRWPALVPLSFAAAKNQKDRDIARQKTDALRRNEADIARTQAELDAKERQIAELQRALDEVISLTIICHHKMAGEVK